MIVSWSVCPCPVSMGLVRFCVALQELIPMFGRNVSIAGGLLRHTV